VDDRVLRERVRTARVGRLATVRPDGRPHVVPVCFAVVGDAIVTAVDAKPKTTRSLVRLDNVRAHPDVTLLVDHYADDWSTLWWVRVDAQARVEAMRDDWATALAEKYEQYARTPPPGPVIVLVPRQFHGWAAGSS
jgi:PPOX class probable F420-dependent enzyme